MTRSENTDGADGTGLRADAAYGSSYLPLRDTAGCSSSVSANGAGSVSRSAAERPTAVILTALPLELRAMRDQLRAPVDRVVGQSVFVIGELEGTACPWTVALACTGVGNLAAGAGLARAVATFSPQVALFVGVAGGRRDVVRGDVVVANSVYQIDRGRSENGRDLFRLRTWPPRPVLVDWATGAVADELWLRRLPDPGRPAPKAHLGPLVAADWVVADERSRVAKIIDEYCSDALAVDMESAGFLASADFVHDVKTIVIRGISDHLSGKSPESDEIWQPRAARNAVAFAVELLDRVGCAGETRPEAPLDWHAEMVEIFTQYS
jgi:nucleoside phosphorylase